MWRVKFHISQNSAARDDAFFDFVEPDGGFLRCYKTISGHRKLVLILPAFEIRGAEWVEKKPDA